MLTPDEFMTVLGVKVNRYLLTEHNPNKIDLPAKRKLGIIGVTIHNTNDLEHVEDDGEQYTRATVNGNMKDVRVHYYVDDLCAWQNLPLYYGNWSCCGGGNSTGNARTIAIECIMDGTTGEANLKARDNCARLAAWLLHSNCLEPDDLYTHTHWLNVLDGKKGTREQLNVMKNSYKMCPYYILPDWNGFCALVATYYNALAGNVPVKVGEMAKQAFAPPFIVKIKADKLNVRKEPGTSSSVVLTVPRGYKYTIVQVKYVGDVPWGALKSGIGYISLLNKYVEFCD